MKLQLGKTLPVRVRAWPELAPELADYVQFNRGITFVLFFIFFLLAVIGIMNTMLMAVFERTRELGMLMALGMRPVQVIGLILAEAAGLAVASLVLGAALGAPLLWYLQVHGLDLGGATGEVVSLAGVVVGHLWYGRQDFPAYSSGRARAGRHGSGVGPLSGVAGCSLSADRSDPKGLAMTSVSPSGENQLAQSLAQSPRYPADGPGLGFGSGLAADLFGLARWRPRADGC